MSILPVNIPSVRHTKKRIRSIEHLLRGDVEIGIGEYSVKITAPNALAMENTRRNALSETAVTGDLLDRVRGKTFLDVGAGYGTEAALAAKAGATDVIAIEADPERVAYVDENAERNGVSIDVRELRVGDGSNSEDVPIDSLSVRPDIVKMDIEGAEWSALAGMPETLSMCERLYLEVHPSLLPKDVSKEDVFALIEDAGLRIEEERSLETRNKQSHVIATRS